MNPLYTLPPGRRSLAGGSRGVNGKRSLTPGRQVKIDPLRMS
jgi:hypothetical protein